MPKKLNNYEFIKKSNYIHDNKYEYSLVNYINNKTKVDILCPIHGIFKQQPDAHLRGQGCLKCKKVTTYEDFVDKSNIIHNNLYQYPKFIWSSNKDKIDIICEKHGKFEQIINDHLNGSGCKICNKNMLTPEKFFNKVDIIKYNYDNFIFNNNSKVIIMCQIHGEFEQNINDHYNGSGCPKCTNKYITTNKFVEKAKIIHGNIYDYSLVEYKDTITKITIVCSKHGNFKQSPRHHLNGSGCPICKSSKGEKDIKIYLENNNIEYIHQYIFKDCKDKRFLPFDFYLPKYNICIEYDGILHFKAYNHFGGTIKLKITQKHDNIKNEYCQNNNIKLVRIKYNQNIVLILDKILK